MNKTRILYLQYTNPGGYPPLEHSSRILAEAGWDVLFLGTGAHGADGLLLPPHERITIRQMPFCRAGWRQKAHYVWFCLWSAAWTLWWRPGWLYASDPLSCPAARMVATLFALRLVYHEHDSPEAAPPNASAFLRLCLAARRWCASRAAVCVLPNRERTIPFAESATPRAPVQVVWNCPSRDEIGPGKPRERGEKIWALYHGSIGPERLPMAVIDALAALPDDLCLRVVGYETIGYLGYMERVVEYAGKLGIAHRIEYRGAIPRRSDMLAICQDCDIGLALVPPASGDYNLQSMTGASNKAFDYMACGLPLVIGNGPDWIRFYGEPGYAISCDPGDAPGLAAALRWYYEHPDRMRAMGERGRQRILSEWNYETQFQPVLDILNDSAEAVSFTRHPARIEP
jgi:glycosyltransferase involved in cell wall biosynthesis